MIKKLLILFLFSIIVVSCGKKADPEYKKSQIIFFGTEVI
tara:strand:+ start:329 stop:448 length:120 start_codon:yes stop_codon:yes gene_type:complete